MATCVNLFKTPWRRASLALALLLAVGLMGGCAMPAPRVAVAPPDARPRMESATNWPIALPSPEGQLTLYQPQPQSLEGNELSARAAVSWVAPDGQEMFGVAEFNARLLTDRDTRLARIENLTSIRLQLPGATPQQQSTFSDVANRELPGLGVTFSMDQLLASLDTAQSTHPDRVPFGTDPPKIYFSTVPATLISVNGSPRLLPVEGHPTVMEVVNTPFILLYDPAGQRYYLKAGTRWKTAGSLTGDWQTVASVPGEIAAAGEYLATPPPPLPYAASTTIAPAHPTPAQLTEAAADARIVVSTEPAELVVTEGPPQFTPIPGGQLLYAQNTNADLFLYQPTQHYFLLLAGRWYTAPALMGPWQYLPASELPADFAAIPADSPKANVLASVPGSAEAREAVLDAEIPQTASVRRDAGNDLSVAYDGDPQFQQIDNGPVSYAINTPYAVLAVDGYYYCCDDAVWYQSATPTGPWTVCTSVPSAIYSIPPTCPLYYVTYVYVYGAYPDYVYCGYLPGYVGCYVDGPTVIFGTGYTYPGWCGDLYFAFPCTWGYCAQYDWWTCEWGFGGGYGWHTGWFSHHWHDRWWPDHWRRFGRRDPALARWWGPHGYADSDQMREHSAALRAAGVRGDQFGGPGRRNIYAQLRNIGRNITPISSARFSRIVGARGDNNIYAGRDGKVYRHTDAGWDVRTPSGWSRVRSVPGASPQYHGGAGRAPRNYAPPNSGLDRDYSARSRGEDRSNAVQHSGEFRGDGGGGGGGSRSSGGGANRGGGGGGGGGRR